jgi:hypothetical protein
MAGALAWKLALSMRVFLTVGLLAALLVAWGCRPDEQAAGGETSGSDLWFRYHFVGTKLAAADQQGTQVKRVASLEQTTTLARHLVARLASSPGVLSNGALTTEQVEQGAAVLRPMIEDLVAYESFLELRGPAPERLQWLLGIALPSERAAAWNAGLKRLTELWDGGELIAVAGPEPSIAGEIRHRGSPGSIRWAEAGNWLLIGIGQDSLTLLDRALAANQEARRPVPPLTDGWLVAEGDMARLAGPLGLVPGRNWPRTELKIAGQEENLRTSMRFVFPEPVMGVLQPWHVPTNIACEPLISFTAMRGVGPLLNQWDGLRALGLDTPPNELYLWAQEHTALATFGAFPAPDPTNQIRRIAERAPGLLGESWHRQGWAQIEWDAANQQAIWKGLLMVIPHLRPEQDVGTNFVVGGLFRQLRTKRPPPAELLEQFVPRPDVLYYGWEITQARLSQWRHLSQLYSVMADQPQLSTNMAALRWLLMLETEPLLGNTVTEITAVSPTELSLVRRSHMGFNGVELVALARWFESPSFPRLGLDLPAPGDARPAGGPGPALP